VRSKTPQYYLYPHMPVGKMWIYCLLFVCFFVCLLRISLPRMKLVALNFALRFIGIQGRESPILENFAPIEVQNGSNWPAREGRWMFQLVTPWRAYQVRAACGHRIGMCGYAPVLKDRRTCYQIRYSMAALQRQSWMRIPQLRAFLYRMISGLFSVF